MFRNLLVAKIIKWCLFYIFCLECLCSIWYSCCEPGSPEDFCMQTFSINHYEKCEFSQKKIVACVALCILSYIHSNTIRWQNIIISLQTFVKPEGVVDAGTTLEVLNFGYCIVWGKYIKILKCNSSAASIIYLWRLNKFEILFACVCLQERKVWDLTIKILTVTFQIVKYIVLDGQVKILYAF